MHKSPRGTLFSGWALAAAALAALPIAGCTPSPPPAAIGTGQAGKERAAVTILISIDGLHPDQLGRGDSPALDAMAARGVAGRLIPSFPTKTFPNHYTLVTGLRPDRHGVVENRMEDPACPGGVFRSSDARAAAERCWWDGAEPIWVTAERAGIRTGALMWSGATAPIRGVRPSYAVAWKDDVTNRARAETLIDWLGRPAAERPRLMLLYMEDVDDSAHEAGPGSPKNRAALRDVDAAIGYLATRLEEIGQPANIVVISDHGLAATSRERLIRVDKLLDPAAFRAIQTGPFLTLEPAPGRDAEVAAALLRPHPQMRCWRKQALPARFRFGRHPRVPSYFCLAEPGWQIFAGEPSWVGGGNHGYDNRDPSMTAAIVAAGPAIARGKRLPPVDNVEVYGLVARLAGVRPLPGDGKGRLVRSALR